MSRQSDLVRRGCPEEPRTPHEPGASLVRIAFLDRDGVLNADQGYVHSVEDFEWMPDALEAVCWLSNNGFLVAIVTNQSGIGRGYYGEEEFMFLTLWMLTEIEKAGGSVAAVYYCPHHPESESDEYVGACRARKPGPGMLERAAVEFPIDKDGSFLVGNKDSDIQAATAFGIEGHLYDDGSLLQFVQQIVRR